MKLKILIWMIGILLISSLVSASYSTDPYDYVAYDDGYTVYAEGTLYDPPSDGDSLGTTFWTDQNSEKNYYDDDDQIYSGNMSFDFDSTSTSGDVGTYYTFGFDEDNKTYQYSLFDDTSGNDGLIYFRLWDGSATTMNLMVNPFCSTTHYCYTWSGGSSTATSIARTNDWHNFTMYIAPNNAYIAGYIDGTLVVNKTTGSLLATSLYFNMASNQVSYRFDAQGDDFLVWNGTPEDRPTLLGDLPLNIFIEYPSYNDTIINNLDYLIRVNGTVSGDSYIYTQINDSRFTNYGTNESFDFINNTALTDGYYILNISANNSFGTFYHTTINFTVDLTSSIITLNSPVAGSSSTDPDGINLNITATDNNELYSFNNTCYPADDTSTVVLSFEQSLLNVSSYTYTTFLNWSYYDHQPFNCTQIVYDTHTTQDMLPADNITKTNVNRSIEFVQPDDKFKFELESADDYNNLTLDYEKKNDRYSFILESSDNSSGYRNRTFVITSEQEIYYIPNSIYRGHFVLDSGYWLDFEGAEGTLTVDRINSTSYRVTDLSEGDYIIYESYGSLNRVESSFLITKSLTLPITNLPGSYRNIINFLELQSVAEITDPCLQFKIEQQTCFTEINTSEGLICEIGCPTNMTCNLSYECISKVIQELSLFGKISQFFSKLFSIEDLSHLSIGNNDNNLIVKDSIDKDNSNLSTNHLNYVLFGLVMLIVLGIIRWLMSSFIVKFIIISSVIILLIISYYIIKNIFIIW